MQVIILSLALIGLISCGKPGYATRYWDCCKPSCSWPEHAGDYEGGKDIKQKNNKARMCSRKTGKEISFAEDTWAKSACDGGDATTCLDQMPIIVSDTLAYGYAATPTSGESVCGKCFKFTFDGKGHWENGYGHSLLAGKQMIVIATNVGHDVEGGQFDVMIPGGGVGLFDGCAGIFSGDMGRQYGGLLSDCEDEVGYELSDKEIYEKRKSCLINKCKTVFSNVPAAVEGCLFHATWMEAAGNPSFTYEPTECPKELSDKY